MPPQAESESAEAPSKSPLGRTGNERTNSRRFMLIAGALGTRLHDGSGSSQGPKEADESRLIRIGERLERIPRGRTLTAVQADRLFERLRTSVVQVEGLPPLEVRLIDDR